MTRPTPGEPDRNSPCARTAVVGDILDQMGFRHQFLPPEVAPLLPHMVVFGRAMPVQLVDADEADPVAYGKLPEALDQMGPGEVYIASGVTAVCASWGELMTVTARVRGAVGAVVNSYHRDTDQILQQNWPVFSRGSYAQDAAYRSAVADYRVTIEIGGVRIAPGDVVVGDREGVLIVPQDLEEEVLRLAQEKSETEDRMRSALEKGMRIAEAFAEYGVM